MTSSSESRRVPLIEESARVGKEEAVTGKVTVRTVTDEYLDTIHETLAREDVQVSRVPVGREVNAAPQVRTENGCVIVPILEERLVVEKRLVLVEELHIRRIASSDTVEVPVNLRKQRAVVERMDTPNPEQQE